MPKASIKKPMRDKPITINSSIPRINLLVNNIVMAKRIVVIVNAPYPLGLLAKPLT